MNKIVVIITLVLFCIISISILSYVNPYSIIYMHGDSMGEDYDDIVVIDTSVDFSDLEDGDIIDFNNKCGTDVQHRLYYDDTRGYYYTKGDNNTVRDFGECYSNPIKPDEFNNQLRGKKVTGFKFS